MTPGPVPHPAPGGASFTETVDGRRGAISARGHLTTRAADMVRGTVEVLRRSGHVSVVVDLTGVRRVDDDGLRALHALADGIREGGGRLTLVQPPAPRRHG